MSTVVTFRVWGDLEKWYLSLPKKEKAAHIREAIRKGLQYSDVREYQMKLDPSNIKVNSVEKKQSYEDLEGKLDNFDMWG